MTDQTAPTGAVTNADRDDPALRQLDPRPLRGVHHGRTGAMWAAMVPMMVAFLISGIGMVIGPNMVVVFIGAGVLVAGVIASLILRALGYGLYQHT